MTGLIITALLVLVVAGALLATLHHQPRQETTMATTPPAGTSSQAIGLEPSSSFEPPAMALDQLDAEHVGYVRRFYLERDVDVSGISGTGVVAEGVAFSDGTAVIHWTAGEHHSTVVWPDVAGVEAIHGHGGATRIVWVDVACRVCGCTDDEACFPSCHWVEPDLCSACVRGTQP